MMLAFLVLGGQNGGDAPPPVLEGYRRLRMRSLPFTVIALGASLGTSACSTPPTSFGSTLSSLPENAGAVPATREPIVDLASLGAALGLVSRDQLYCPRGEIASYEIATFLPRPKIDATLSLEAIGRLTRIDFHHLALGATEGREVAFALIAVRTLPSTRGGVCAYATRVTLTLGLTARKIHIASDFAGTEPCVYGLILAHEKRHVALDDRIMKAAAASLRRNAAQRFDDIDGVWGKDATAAQHALQRRIETDEDALRAEIREVRVEAHAEKIDTPQERLRLVAACGGRLKQLYPGYG